jgi:hypothetical protein
LLTGLANGVSKLKTTGTGDLNAIGLMDNEEKHLVYISAYDDKDFFVSLENLETGGDHPYQPVGDFDNVNLEGLEKIFAQHLRLETTDAQQKI